MTIHPYHTHRAAIKFENGDYDISGELAARILEEAHFHGQRETDDVFVGMHMENIRRRLMLECSQIAFCRIGESYYLVNGKHRITAVARLGTTVRFSVVVYDCNNMNEVRSIYARFDSVQRSRTSNQIIKAYELDDRLGLQSRTSNALFGAVPLLENNLRPLFNNQKDHEDLRKRLGIPEVRLDAAMKWAEEARTYERLISPAFTRLKSKLIAANVMSVALVTLRYQPRIAEEFWSGVGKNDGLHRGDPRMALVHALMERGVKIRQNAVMISGTAWNAWYRGATLMQISVKGNTEIRIAGTPFDGKDR